MLNYNYKLSEGITLHRSSYVLPIIIGLRSILSSILARAFLIVSSLRFPPCQANLEVPNVYLINP